MIVLPYLLHDLKLINLKQTSRQGDMEYALYGKSKLATAANLLVVEGLPVTLSTSTTGFKICGLGKLHSTYY